MGRIDKHRDDRGLGDHVVQQPQPFALEFRGEQVDSSHVAARPVQVLHKALLHRVVGGRKEDWYCHTRALGCLGSLEACDNYRHLMVQQVGQ